MARLVRIALIVFTILALTMLPGDSTLAEYLASQFYVADVVQQFNSFSEHGGQPLAVSLWQGEGANPEFIGDDATSAAHYQGMARVDGPGGNPYLVLMRNGNPVAAGTDYPAEILINLMESKSGVTEALGTNCVSTSGGKCEPSAGDRSYKSIHLDGYNDAFTGWKHVGSGQMIAGNRLLVPLEKICDYNSSTEACNNNDENADQLVGGIQVLDLSYPGSGHIEAEITTYLDTNGVSHKFPTIGVLGAIKDLVSDHYLLLITSGSFNHGRTVWFMDFDPAALTITLIDDWCHTELADPSKWCNNCTFPLLRTNSLEWQMINFVRDRMTDDLYIITAANSTTVLTDGADWARLFKVTPESGFGPEDNFTITYEAEKHFYLNDPIKMGDFDAAEGVYVTPAGRLLLYTSPHDNDGWDDDDCSDPTGAGRCHAVQMGEYAATYYNPTTFTVPPADQTATEGTGKNFVLGYVMSTYATTYTGEVDWGDGSPPTTFSMVASGLIPNQPHTYPDGPATIQASVTMTNADGFQASDTFNVTISNVAPTLSSFTRSGVDNDAVQFFKSEFYEHFSDPGEDTLETLRITSLPAFGTLALSGVPVVIDQIIPYANLDNLVFTPGGISGSTSFGWNASDGNAYAASSALLTLNITDENQYPSGWESNVTTLEDQQYVFQSSDFLFSDPDVGDTLQAIQTTELPDHGTLYLDYNANQQIDNGEAIVVALYDGYVSLAQLNAGVLRYWPDPNYRNTDYFRFWVSDGKLWSIGPGDVMWVAVTSVPDPPVVTNFVKYGTEDIDLSFTSAIFSSHFSDADGNSMTGIKIVSLPDHGELLYSGVPVTPDQEIATANIPSLIYRPDANWNGVTTFGWNGFDGSFFAVENAVLSLSSSAVNDPPTSSNQSHSMKTLNGFSPPRISPLAIQIMLP